jgi:hypothetical protein
MGLQAIKSLLGLNNNSNGFDSSQVAANADGSALERLEYLQTGIRKGSGSALGTNESLLDVLYGSAPVTAFPSAALPATGKSIAAVLREAYDQQEKAVVKAAATLVNGATLFTIAGGSIQIMELFAYCLTANDTTASTLQFSSTPTLGSAKTISGASASLASAAAGACVILNPTALTTAPDLVTAANGGVALGANLGNRIIVHPGILTAVVGVGSTTGTWEIHMRYKPLARGVTVS